MEPRIIEADRQQLRWDMVDLESQLAPDHMARVVWSFVCGLDLGGLYEGIKARGDQPGRPAADPKVLLAVWLYATIEAVGSARALERLCETHIAYRWLCGGVPVNYHGLSDFRTAHGEVLDSILTQGVAGMMAAGLVTLDEVAVDGTKVRARASRRSFRNAGGLERYERLARQRLDRLRAELDGDTGASERRRRAAQDRAERDVARRAEAARTKLAALLAEKEKRAKRHKRAEAEKATPSVSTSDPEARQMRFSDGATRPGYNLLVGADPRTLIVVSVQATDRRNDAGLVGPLIEDVAARYGRRPSRCLADTTMATHADIIELASHREGSTQVYTPVLRPRENVKPLSETRRRHRLEREPEPIKRWRALMETLEGQAIYRRRSRIETVNAQIKNRGLWRFALRGLRKVRCEVLLAAIAHNLIRRASLQAATT